MWNQWTEVRRGAAYLLIGLPTAMAGFVALPAMGVVALSCALGIGLLLLPWVLAGLHQWASWHQRRAGRLLGTPVPADRLGTGRGLRHLVTRPATWRDIRWLAVHLVTGVPLGLFAMTTCGVAVGTVVVTPLWPVVPLTIFTEEVSNWGEALLLGLPQCLLAGALAYWTVPRLARVHARICLRVLAPSAVEQLAERVDTLADTRAKVVDAHGAELRRIERDLHDGTQARLVALSMRLGMAREALDDPETLAALLADAHRGAEEAMVELREVLRSVYPPILADRGLAGALHAMGGRSGVPTEITVGDLGAVPAGVEAAAYFVVAEALTNVAKHSRAEAAAVHVDRAWDTLRIEVVDDGTGSADEALGTGIVGIRRRAAALDGTVVVTSPAGGPTSIVVELPCGS